ncbi:hypothetical protein BH11ARM2_BH11ARM2_08850 [soil metagenome]
MRDEFYSEIGIDPEPLPLPPLQDNHLEWGFPERVRDADATLAGHWA